MHQDGQRRRFSSEELQRQEVVELPQRDLMLAVTVLGIPIIGLSGVELHIS